jgi:transposase
MNTQVKNTRSGVRLTFKVKEREKNRLMTRLFGKTILFTDEVAWSSEDIVLGYRGRYKLEDVFCTMKDSEACCWWPMNHWTDQKIRVHGFFCVMALLLLSLIRRQLAQKGIDLSITRLIRRLTEIEETALAYDPRPAARGKTKGRSVFELTNMDPEQRALFDTLDLARHQHPTW